MNRLVLWYLRAFITFALMLIAIGLVYPEAAIIGFLLLIICIVILGIDKWIKMN